MVRPADQARHVGRGQDSYYGSAVRTEGPKPKAQVVDSRDGVLGKGGASLLSIS